MPYTLTKKDINKLNIKIKIPKFKTKKEGLEWYSSQTPEIQGQIYALSAAADTWMTDLVEIIDAGSDDVLHIVDVSNTTNCPDGQSSKIQVGNLLSPAFYEERTIASGDLIPFVESPGTGLSLSWLTSPNELVVNSNNTTLTPRVTFSTTLMTAQGGTRQSFGEINLLDSTGSSDSYYLNAENSAIPLGLTFDLALPGDHQLADCTFRTAAGTPKFEIIVSARIFTDIANSDNLSVRLLGTIKSL